MPNTPSFTNIVPFQRRNTLMITLVMLPAAIALWLFLCCRSNKLGAHVFLVIDRSGSNHDSIDGSIAAAAQIAASMNPATDTVTCFAMDSEVVEIYDQAAPEDAETFRDAVAPVLQKEPARPGTYPARMWVQVAAHVRAERLPCAVCLFWDGDDDGPIQAHASALWAFTDMAGIPSLTGLTVYGIAPRNRAALRALGAPLGGRLHLYSADAIDTAPLLADLESARERAAKGAKN